MAKKSAAWTPSPQERIDWSDPFISISGLIPGYLLQERFGYSEDGWKAWLKSNRSIVRPHNRKPYIVASLLHTANAGGDGSIDNSDT